MTEIENISKKLSELQIKHFYKQEKDIIYFSYEKDYTIYLKNFDGLLTLKVFKKEVEKQDAKTLKLCRMIKYNTLKKLQKLNQEHFENGLNLEPLTEIDEIKLFKDEKIFNPKNIDEVQS